METENYNLQYGDIIQIDSPTNLDLHEKIFYINFINSSKITLLNQDNITTLEITEQGKLLEESIDNIILLHRATSPSFIIQNNISVNKSISITFGGSLPKILNGIVTNIEEDMIEITLIPSNEVIYIDFAYSGIPENLNIEKIIIKDSKETLSEKDTSEKTKIDKLISPSEKLEDISPEFLDLENVDDLDYELIKHIDEERLNEILLDNFELEDEYQEVYHNVNVPENEKRYTLETQLNDYMDNILNTYKQEERNEDLISNINLELNRYKELRELYSDFDDNNNAIIPTEKGEFYKPLKEIILNLNKKLYWLIPVVYNSKNLIYNEDSDDFDEDYINKIKMGEFIENLNSVIYKWTNNSSKDKINDYRTYINNLLNIYNNTTNKYTSDFNSINFNSLDVNTQIQTINDIYDDFYSYCINDKLIDKTRFSTEIYNEGQKMLETDYINNKRIYNFKDLTPNEKIIIISFITLPLPIFNFSKINLEYTSIYNKSSLNLNFFNYFQVLNNGTNINKFILEETNYNKFINTHDTIHDNNFLEDICNFSIEDKSSYTGSEKFNLLLESFIPTNSSAIEYLSKTNKYVNYRSLIEDIQSLNIDMYNLTNKDYNIINKLLKENIDNYKKEYNTNKELLNKLINILNAEPLKLKEEYKLNFDIITSELKEELYDNYKIIPEIFNSNSELINSFINIDGGKFFINTLNKTIMDLIVSNLLDNYIKEAKNPEGEEKSVSEEDTCEKYYLSKKYTTKESMEDDNSKQIFFDAIYDNTVYSLVNEYANEKETMDTKHFFEFLTDKIMDIMNVTKKNAVREAKAIIEEKREIIDGDYALLIDKETKKNYIYIRQDSKWIVDEKFKNDFYIDSNKILCDANKECISVDDKCIDSSKLEKKNLKADVDKILATFQAKYNLSVEEIKGRLNNNYENAKKYLKNIIEIKNEKDKYVNNIILSNYIEISDDIKISPYEKLKDKVLAISDFVKRQEYIKKFCLKFTRESVYEEENHWLYCNKTGVRLIPNFLLKLANAFSNKRDYIKELDSICADQGTISDDNNYWVDKYSGYIIKNIEFSTDEGYDAEGFKLNTKEILENEYNINLSKTNLSTNPDVKLITNIIKSMSQMIGINLESQNQFIINNVITTHTANIPSKELYEKLIAKASKKEGKVKTLASYEETYNQLLLLLTLSYLIVGIQINIPSFKTKKTFPGCIKSFSGYPLDGDQDKTTLIYISCVASKIKSSIKPWNTILKISEANIVKKLEALIEKYIINDKIIIELFQKKREYLILNKEEFIPDELSISNWQNFMPALYDLKISKENNLPLSDTFYDELLETFRKGKKNELLETLFSKNIYLSNTIIESIQKIVEINSTLLENSAGDPFLENACCNSSINTINYFISKDKTILENSKLVANYNKIIHKINNLNKSSILYNHENTKTVLPLIKSDFSEETIYKTFIYYCNFTNNLPIDDELRSICMDKPADLNAEKNILEIIESLKSQGKIYNKSSVDDLLNIIYKRNILASNLNYPIVNNIESLRIIINNYLESPIEKKSDENLFEKLNKLFDSFDINITDEKELDIIKNYLARTNTEIKSSLVDFIKKLPTMSKIFRDNIEKFLDFEINVDNCQFYINYLDNLINIFPNIVLNKQIEFRKIPPHWLLSYTHNIDILNILEKYYKKLNNLSIVPGLDIVFKLIKNKSKIFLKLIKYCKYIGPVQVSNSPKEILLPSIFDKEFIKYFYTYIFYSIFYELIKITKDSEFILEIGEVENYKEEETNNAIINYIYEFLNIMNNHLNLTNNTYKKVKEKISYAKEKEKDLITQYLKDLTDEEREVENIFKNNKLESWSAGLQKGLTQYVASNYDDERNKIEQLALKEYKLRQNNNVTEMNKEIYKIDEEELDRINKEIEDEEYNMNSIPDDDDIDSENEYD
tara:strand:- start:3743 stop:9484 length:5742 start_codon:yes stop_codon:yes gene_type:complete